MQNRSFTDLNNCKWLFIRKVGSWGGCETGLLSVFFVCFANRVALYEGTLAVLVFCFGVCYFVLRAPYKEQWVIERVDMWMNSCRNALNRLIRHCLVERYGAISYLYQLF